MNTNIQRSHSLPRNRFGQLSKNMFFARHVAQPRYLKFITGAGGQRICHVREQPLQIPVSTLGDCTQPLISDPQFNIDFTPNSSNEVLLQSYTDRLRLKKRRERLLPPIPGWNATGMVVEDTDKWRRELARIAEMVGLVTPDELIEIQSRKEPPSTPAPPQTPSLSSMNKSSITPTRGQYSRQSGRWNETPKSANRSRSFRRGSSMYSTIPKHLFCVDEQEREMWMLQVLCQILQTENINEIQSWLVSSGPNEKEAVRQLITKAIQGLEENGRLQASAYFDGNTKGTQVNMDSFGSLLANKYPYVSSSIPVTPLDRNSSKSSLRPQTAPTISVGVDIKPEYLSDFHSVDENREKQSPTRKSLISSSASQPIRTNIQRDVQILTIDDGIKQNKYHVITTRTNDPIPF